MKITYDNNDHAAEMTYLDAELKKVERRAEMLKTSGIPNVMLVNPSEVVVGRCSENFMAAFFSACVRK